MMPVSHELLSMIMYAIELNPLLTRLAEGLQGLKTTPTSSKLSVFTYADDFTIILASPAEVEADRTALRLYQRAAAAVSTLPNPQSYHRTDKH
jgi:hypothetical protein